MTPSRTELPLCADPTAGRGHSARVRARNQNRESVVQRLRRTFAVLLLIIAFAACSGASHRSLPAPSTASATTPSLCQASEVVSAGQYVPPVAGMLQVAAGLTPAQPVEGVVTATDHTGARCTVTVPNGGHFMMYLTPGTYRLTGTSPKFNDSSSPCRAASPVALQPLAMGANRPATIANVICDRM